MIPTFLLTDRFARLPCGPLTPLPPVCRLGLATRGDSDLTPSDIELALSRGINFLNWCGCPDALSQTINTLGVRRKDVVICTQFEARSAEEAQRELDAHLRALNTDWIDLLTFYYVEAEEEWRQIAGRGGALEYCQAARRHGRVRGLGLTSHQRKLAAAIAAEGQLDALMLRYNAAHRGAEQDVFTVTDARKMPLVVYTCLRWGGLLRPTPDDPPGFVVPGAAAWYRFALQSPSVAVALMAPANRRELAEDLQVLDAETPLTAGEYEVLTAHGARARRHAGGFP